MDDWKSTGGEEAAVQMETRVEARDDAGQRRVARMGRGGGQRERVLSYYYGLSLS
jgi:hypothetical protein